MDMVELQAEMRAPLKPLGGPATFFDAEQMEEDVEEDDEEMEDGDEDDGKGGE
jgi:hypothetical protein